MSLSTRAGVLAYGLAATIIVADQAVKAWILTSLKLIPGLPYSVWGPLRLTLVDNSGVSFGLFQSDAPWTRWALAAFSLVVAVALGAWVRRAEKLFTGIAVGLIMGGAVGNLVDRLRRGAVIDFVDVQALHFPWVFNLADAAISVGIALLLLEGMFTPHGRER
jgi:signal peptidase II